jgi:hypothetical protein
MASSSSSSSSSSSAPKRARRSMRAASALSATGRHGNSRATVRAFERLGIDVRSMLDEIRELGGQVTMQSVSSIGTYSLTITNRDGSSFNGGGGGLDVDMLQEFLDPINEMISELPPDTFSQLTLINSNGDSQSTGMRVIGSFLGDAETLQTLLDLMLRVTDPTSSGSRPWAAAEAFQADSEVTAIKVTFTIVSKVAVPAIVLSGGSSATALGEQLCNLFPLTLFDCKSTDNFNDCAARALGFIYRAHRIREKAWENTYLGWGNPWMLKSVVKGPTHPNSVSRVKSRHKRGVYKFDDYANNVQAKEDAMSIYGTLIVQDILPPEEFGRALIPFELEYLCEDSCLGQHARIIVFHIEPNTYKLSNVLVTKDKRLSEPHPEHKELNEELSPFREPASARETDWYYLLLFQGHYFAVMNPAAIRRAYYRGKKFKKITTKYQFCMEEGCFKWFTHQETHRCVAKCDLCYSTSCEGKSDQMVSCNECNRSFFGEDCYLIHKRVKKTGPRKGRSTCDEVYKCTRCSGDRLLTFNNSGALRSDHKCENKASYCKGCHRYCVYPDKIHFCPIRNKRNQLKAPETRMADEVFYWDAETIQDADTGKHTSNLIVVMHANDNVKQYGFYSTQEFCNWVFEGFESRSHDVEGVTTFIAHNSGGFDSHLVLEYVIKTRRVPTTQIKTGNRLMYLQFAPRNFLNKKTGKMEINKGASIKFADSLLFLQMPLKKFTKTFDLDPTKFAKGDFPHLFNTPENQDYAGGVPHIKYFAFKSMTGNDFEKFFLGWYLPRVRETYPTKEEADAFISTKIRPYLRSINSSYKWREPAKSKATVYKGPWVFKDEILKYCVSDVALLKEGFETLRSIFLTFWPDDVVKGFDPAMFTTIASLVKKLMMIKFYPSLPKLVNFPADIEKWLRRGFHGGRTEVFQLYKKCPTPAHEIHYEDVCSLYPFINKNGWYTVGAPLVWVNVEDIPYQYTNQCQRQFGASGEFTLDSMLPWLLAHNYNPNDLRIADPVNGICMIECDYTAPADLHVPVLPSVNPKTGKLLFSLAPGVGAVKCSIELAQAVEMGYVLSNVKQVVFWPIEQCVKGYFKEYVDTFLKIKMEAAGFADRDDEKKLDDYIARVEEKEGIKLDKVKIGDRKNPGLYAVSKLCLNSVWGKWAQRGDTQSQSRIFFENGVDLQEFHDLVADMTLRRHVDILVDGEAVQIRYAKTDEHSSPAPNTNIMIGILTTCQARCMMYRAYLNKLQPDQLLYMDTDSVIYMSGPGLPRLPLGEFLGDLTNEFEDPSEKCVEFIGGAPKAYGYKLVERKDPEKVKSTMIKCKGFNLKGGWIDPKSASNMLTYETARKMIVLGAIGDEDPAHTQEILDVDLEVTPADELVCKKMTVQMFGIRADRKSGLTTRNDIKRSFRYNFDKREVDYENVTSCCIPTYPFTTEL